MSRKQKNIVRILFIVVLLFLTVLLLLCSDRIREWRDTGNNTSPTDAPQLISPSPLVPTDTLVPGTGTATVTPTPTEALADASDLIDISGSNPHSSVFESIASGRDISTLQVAYSNFTNGMTSIYMESGTLEFSDNGYYNYITADGATHTYRIGDYVNLSELFSGNSLAEEGDWFFLGALETADSVYVHYDYWGKDELSLFFRMTKTGQEALLVYAALYDETDSEGSFTAANEAIFFIYNTLDSVTGEIESSIMQAEPDGSKSGILVSFPDGYSAHHLSVAENAVIFMLTDPDGTTSLLHLDTRTQSLAYIIEQCTVSDYLYISGQYAIVGITSSTLIAYDMISGEELSIPLVTGISSPKFGPPLVSETQVYIQYFRWDSSFQTCVLPIELSTGTCGEAIILRDTLCYVTGISGNTLYAENSGSYIELIP